MSKRYMFLCFVSLVIVSCAAPQEKSITRLPSTPTSISTLSTVVPFTPTPEKIFVPKQNDLIFIEFFAVT
jgi:hypothetical protein